MSKKKEARKASLAKSLEDAVVEHIGVEGRDPSTFPEGTYSVFVPGAVREENLVKAGSEEEAKEKVRVCLEKKIDSLPEKDPTGKVVIQPDNLKLNMKTKIKVGENKNG